MKALFYMGPNKMELRDIEKPSSNNDGVVVKIIEAGICGTDVKTFQRGHHLFKPPVILGHECYGVVSEKPSFVNHVDVGDYVVVAPYGECNVCEICRKGFPELCKNKTFITSGCFTQYLIVPPQHSLKGLFKIKEPASHMVLTEPLACVISSIRKFGIPNHVLIIGGGIMGTLFAIYMNERGCNVKIVEISEWRAEFLRKLGFGVMDSSDIREKSYDMVIIATTLKKASDYLEVVRDGGKLILFGGYPKDMFLTFDPFHIHYREVTISGSFGYSLPDFATALDELSLNKEKYEKLITHVYSIDEYKKAFEKAISKECMKVSLRM